MRYTAGVVDLALTCAHRWDQSDRAVSYWLDECPSGDAREGAYKQRRSCHELVFDSLASMDDLLDEAAAPSRPAGSTSCTFFVAFSRAESSSVRNVFTQTRKQTAYERMPTTRRCR